MTKRLTPEERKFQIENHVGIGSFMMRRVPGIEDDEE